MRQASIVGPAATDICSDDVPVVVALRGTSAAPRAGKLTLGSVSTLYDGRRDTDKLRLVCEPAP